MKERALDILLDLRLWALVSTGLILGGAYVLSRGVS